MTIETFAPLFSRLRELWRGLLELLPQLLLALVIVFLTWALAKLAARLTQSFFRRSHARRSVQELMGNLANIATWATGLTVAATVLFPSLTPGKIVAGLGLGSVALGFAFKDVFENFFAGLVILIRDVIEIDDFIQADDIVGRVEQIAIRDTHVRRPNGERVIIPNGLLFKNPIRVLTDQPQRRIQEVVGVDYDEDHEAARALIRDTLASCSTVAQDRPVQVLLRALAGSSVDFELTWWTGSTPGEIRESRGEVLNAVKTALDRAGVSIPFPHRTLTFKEPLSLSDRRAERALEHSA